MRKTSGGLLVAACLCWGLARGGDVRVGIIGLDTSHAIEFTKALNATNPAPEYAGFRVVAAYPKGSEDIPSSTNRVPGYVEKVKALGVEIVGSIDELLAKSDVVLLEANDGRPHLKQALPVFKSGKRVFVDKPVAGTLAQCVALYDAAARYKTPMFSSSSLRYTLKTAEIASGKFGPVVGAETYGPCSLEPTHPDLFWYGIHGVESLFTVMGTGCQSVKRGSVTEEVTTVDKATKKETKQTVSRITVTGTWAGGRTGTFTESKGYGGKAVGEKGEADIGTYDGYDPLLYSVVHFFRTGVAPVSPEETLEIYAFMEAADESKRRGGAEVTLKEVMDKALAEARK